jgi:mevalonate kinase
MKWLIPAKTFLLGEYAAVAEASALIFTTEPYFELSLIDSSTIGDIHPQSPAGLWWQQDNILTKGLFWYDPYYGQGGLGASSAQFLATYMATYTLKNRQFNMQNMLQAYYKFSWTGKGLRPSGYDVIAQTQQGCVFINKQNKIIECFEWPFPDLSFLLIHTGIKLATHHHLQETTLPQQVNDLSIIVDQAKKAFTTSNSEQLIDAINKYHYQLNNLKLVAQHSLELINNLKQNTEILAIKGCGALGADIILIVCARYQVLSLKQKLVEKQYSIIATEKNLTTSFGNNHIEGRL